MHGFSCPRHAESSGTRGSNLHWQVDYYPLYHQGSLCNLLKDIFFKLVPLNRLECKFSMNTISHMNLLLEHFDYKTLFAYICMVIIIKQRSNKTEAGIFYIFFQILIICMSVVILFKDSCSPKQSEVLFPNLETKGLGV